jgi:SAM-dependent methyltransferase
MEKVNCALCGRSDTELLYQERDRRHGGQTCFRVVRCRHCGLMYANPRPTREEMAAYYPEDYTAYAKKAIDDEPFFLQKLNRRSKMRARCRSVAAWKTGGRILDVGCATGVFLSEMTRYGPWEPYGVEPNGKAADYATRRLGLDVFVGELPDAHFPDGYFDVVTMWDVFEHVHDPMATLGEIHRVLAPDGLLVVSVPNADSVDARLFGRHWIGLDPPRHLYVFSPCVLETALRHAGFHVLQERCSFGGYFTFVLSLELWLGATVTRQGLRSFARRILYVPGLRFLFLPYFALLDRLNKGAIITVHARAITRMEKN